ncbi:MAG: RNA polymerase factor sigma-54 [Pseudonocardiales bacterium]
MGTFGQGNQAQRVLALAPEQRLEHRVAPAQVLLAELLSLPNAELEDRIAVELGANPALELPVPASCPGCGSVLWGLTGGSVLGRGGCVRCSAGDAGTSRGSASLDAAERVVARLSPRDQLLTAAAATLTPTQRTVAAHLLADTDDLGVLTEPVPRIAARLGVPVGALQEIITILRAASGYAGLCATSLTDRLRLEVRSCAEHGRVPDEVEKLISSGLDQLGGSTPGAVGLTSDELAHALAWLRAQLSAEVFDEALPAPPAPVDIVVRRAAGGLVVAVVPGPWSAVQVAESYLAAAAVTPGIADHLARARDFIGALARRERTVLRVAESTVRRQAQRVVAGRGAHLPLTRREIAAELTVHESTVSRVVAGKYVLLPTGEIVPFAALFGPSLGVQECLREVIGQESGPLSDAALVRALAARGHHLARRTVAKYRRALGIPDYRSR